MRIKQNKSDEINRVPIDNTPELEFPPQKRTNKLENGKQKTDYVKNRTQMYKK